MSLTTQNPYSVAYGAIIDSLEAWPALMAVVRIGNIQTLQKPGYRPRTNTGAGDRIELKLMERRIMPKPLDKNQLGWWSSCLYPLTLSSGSMGIDKINLVQVLVEQALTNAGTFLGLQQQDVIHRWDFAEVSLTPNDVEAERPEWTAVAGVLVTFAMSRADFLARQFS